MLDKIPNWLHLDLKGCIPSEGALLTWLDFFAECGFNGIVWEYEDRIPWRTWPGTLRDGYTIEQWRRIWKHCEKLGLQVVPLIQSIGHMEWLLQHPQYAPLRENGRFNELCPSHPDTLPRLKRWIDEVIAIHPSIEYMHVGGDEPWNLATCPRCSERANSAATGKIAVYLDHVREVCEHLVRHSVRPLLWADVFWRHDRPELMRALPKEAIPVEWCYRGSDVSMLGPRSQRMGRRCFGASAIRCGFDENAAIASINSRLANISAWQRELQNGNFGGLIHTTWGRTRSLTPLYGPWHGWLPAFIEAGRCGKWSSAPEAFRSALHRLEGALHAETSRACDEVAAELAGIASSLESRLAQEAVRWWQLALRHRAMTIRIVHRGIGYCNLESTQEHRGGLDPHWLDDYRRQRAGLSREIDQWSRDVELFWQDNALNDFNEYVQSRTAGLSKMLHMEWSASRLAEDARVKVELFAAARRPTPASASTDTAEI